MKRTAILFLVFFAGVNNHIIAQTAQSINITVNIAAPYSPFYSDYSGSNASKVMLLVQNLSNSAKTIKLAGQLMGNNGIKISTKSNYVPLQPITLNPNETKQLNGLALKDIFDLNTLNVYGIDKVKIVQTSRIPEGNYSFCIQALDYNTGQPLSASSPLGCTTIDIAYPEPPFLVQPMDAEEVTPTNPQSLIFNWMNAGFVPGSTQYQLQVAEMPMVTADPNQVLNSTSLPLINKIVTGFSYPLNASDLPLVEGKRYAWRVISSDPTGKVVFKNNGISGAKMFIYKRPYIASTFNLDDPEHNIRVKDLTKLEFKWSFTDNSAQNFVNTNLVAMPGSGLTALKAGGLSAASNAKYQLHFIRVKNEAEKAADRVKQFSKVSGVVIQEDELVLPVNTESISYNSSPEMVKYLKNGNNYIWYVVHSKTNTVSEKRNFTVQFDKDINNYNVTLAGHIQYQFYEDKMAGKKAYPLSQTRVQAVQFTCLVPIYKVTKKVMVKENGKDVLYTKEVDSVATVSDLSKYPYGQLKISSAKAIAFGGTDSSGNFRLTVPIVSSQHTIVSNNIAVSGSSQRYAQVQGIALRINDERFSDPNWYIFPTSDKTEILLNDQTVQVFDYKLDVKFSANTTRDYKGKLYVLKPKYQTVEGEVDQLVGQSKDVRSISIIGAENKSNINYTNYFTKYEVVGSQNIAATSGPQNVLNKSFNKLVPARTASNGVYTVYFEPDNTQDALYFSPQTVSSSNLKTVSFLSTVFKNQTAKETVVLGPKFLTMKVSGRYLYKWRSEGGRSNPKLPLPEGTGLTLMKGMMIQGSAEHNLEMVGGKRIAMTKVGKNGEYSFDVGLFDYDYFNAFGGGNDLVVTVDGKYYASDEQIIKYDKNEDVKMPELVSLVREFTFTSRLLNQTNAKPVTYMQVYLCRKKGAAPATVPPNEGDPTRKTYFKTVHTDIKGVQYDILDTATAGFYGEFTFKRLVYPSKDEADQYFILAEPKRNTDVNFITETPFELTKILFSWVGLQSVSYHVFNDAEGPFSFEYNKNVLQCVPVVPQNPYIEGAVYPYSNAATTALSGVKIEMFAMDRDLIKYDASSSQFAAFYKDRQPIGEPVFTESNGRFMFNLPLPPPPIKGVSPKAIGRLLRLSKQGFITTYKPVQDGIPLIKGQKAVLNPLYMDLPLDISVYVADNAGKPVKARIIVGDDFSWGDTKTIFNVASLKSPSGLVSFTIIPDDKVLYKTTVVQKTVSFLSKNYNLLVKDNTHNIIVRCIDANTNNTVEADVFVTNITETPVSDKFSMPGLGKITTLSFAAAGNQFNLKVVPTGNYTIVKTYVKSDKIKTEVVTVYVQPAVSIKLAVSSPNGLPIGYKYFDINIKDFDQDEYVIVGLPYSQGARIDKLPAWKTILIGVTKSGYMGVEHNVDTDAPKTVQYKLGTLQPGTINSLYGFPIALTKYSPLGSGSYVISGKLNPAGNLTRTKLTLANTENWLRFDDVIITENGTGAYKTTTISDITFSENTLDAFFNNDYRVVVRSSLGLKLVKVPNGGSIIGNVSIDPSSLAKGVYPFYPRTGTSNLFFLNKGTNGYSWVTQPQDGKIRTETLNTFTTAVSDLNTEPMLVSDYQRKSPIFGVIDKFRVSTDDKVLLTNSGITFNATIGTNFEEVVNPNMEAKATFNLNSSSFYFTDRQPLSVTLNQWRLEFSTWNLSGAGFYGNGSLNALGLTIPFKRLQLTGTKIGYGEFEVKNLKLLNVQEITFNNNEVISSFGFDKGYSKERGAWSLAILAKTSKDVLASIKGLPDLATNDEIQIRNINLYDTGDSNDTKISLVENHPLLSLNNIAKFKPITVLGSPTSVSFRGNLDMDIPNLTGLGNVTYDLTYKIVNNNFEHYHDGTPFKNLVLDTKGIKVEFSAAQGDQVFKNGELKLAGKLTDKDPKSSYEINVELSKNKDKTDLVISDKKPEYKKIYLSGGQSGSYLANSEGGMALTDGVWNNFAFQGDLTDADGINADQSRLAFVVKGDLITDKTVVNKDAIGVKNLDAGPVSGLNLTYDFHEKALIGSVSGLKQSTPFADLTMDLELKVKSGEWYIFSNAIASNIKYMTMLNQVGVGTIIGNADITASQLTSLSKHYRENDLPEHFKENFQHVSGMGMVLSADMKLPVIPSFDLQLSPVAHCEVNYGIYGNLYYKVDFSTKKEDLSMALGARVGAYVKLGVGASIGLACAGINLGADAHADLEGSLKPFATSGNTFSLTGLLKFSLTGEAYVGAGVCNSHCETPCIDAFIGEICSPIPCFRKSWGGSLTLGLSGEFNDSGFHFGSISSL